MTDTTRETAQDKPTEYGVQYRMTFDDRQTGDKGHAKISTKLINCLGGPFEQREIAVQFLFHMANKPNFIDGQIAPMMRAEDVPSESAEERQIPASEDVVREMVKNGQIPGVPADAKVSVIDEAAGNTVPFAPRAE